MKKARKFHLRKKELKNLQRKEEQGNRQQKKALRKEAVEQKNQPVHVKERADRQKEAAQRNLPPEGAAREGVDRSQSIA